MDGDVLDQFVLPGAPLHLLLQKGVLVVQQIPRRFQLQVVSDPGQHDGRGDRLVDVVDGPSARPCASALSSTLAVRKITGISRACGISCSACIT